MNVLGEILNSKLSSHKLQGTIFRKRLEPLLSRIVSKKITVVTAGAGFGKSTAVAQACEQLGCGKVWYRLDEYDDDPARFIRYIAAGIKRIRPDFGERIFTMLGNLTSESKINSTFLSTLVNDIERAIDDDFIIVLDDCHIIAEYDEINTIIRFLADYLPDHIHLVMTSRTGPPIPVSKYRVQMAIHEIGQDDLTFDLKEIGELFEGMLGHPVADDVVREMYEKSEGWAASLILFFHLAKGVSDKGIGPGTFDMATNRDMFKEYLSENVFEDQPKHIRDFLLKTSLLNRLEGDFCNRLLAIDDSDMILNALERNHLFTSRADNSGDVYAYHHLFQEFLRDRLKKELGDKAAVSIHIQAGRLYESLDQREDAIHHFLEAGSFDDVFRILLSLTEIYLVNGRITSLQSLLNRIPEPLIEKNAHALLILAKICVWDNKLDQSMSYARKAYALARAENNQTLADKSLVELGTATLFSGHFFELEDIFRPVLASEGPREFFVAQAYFFLVFGMSHAGEMEKAEHYYNEGVAFFNSYDPSDLPEGYREMKTWLEISYGFRLYLAGDPVTSLRHMETVYYDVQDLDMPSITGFYQCVLAGCYILLGRIEKAREMIDKGFAALKGLGYHGNQTAWLRLHSFIAYFLDKDYENALKEAEINIEEFRQGGSKWGELYTLVNFIGFYGKTGQEAKASQAVMDCYELVNNGYPIPWANGRLNVYLAVFMGKTGNHDAALEHLSTAEKILEYSTFETCFVKIMRALCLTDAGKEKEAEDQLCEALAIGETCRYEGPLFLFDTTLIPHFLAIYSSGRFQSYIILLLKSYWKHISESVQAHVKNSNKTLKTAAMDILKHMPAPEASPLRVHFLGQFRVFVGDREIDGSEWKSGPAREIFKFLAFKRNLPAVHRDVLLELIWPDEDCTKTIKRLHVVLPALRKILEPDVQKGGSSYLLRDDELYRLDFKDNGFVDVDLFLDEIKRAANEYNPDKKLRHLLDAERYYTGDFLAEDVYRDWCLDERETLQRQYLNVLKDIMAHHEQANDRDKVIAYALKYLKTDPYDERVYLKLMRCYVAMGNYPMALKMYDKCRMKIVDELNCPLDKKTEDFHHDIMSRYPADQAS